MNIGKTTPIAQRSLLKECRYFPGPWRAKSVTQHYLLTRGCKVWEDAGGRNDLAGLIFMGVTNPLHRPMALLALGERQLQSHSFSLEFQLEKYSG